MGFIWILEPVSWVIGENYVDKVFEVLNSLQGLIVFVLFVWTPKVRKLILLR